MELEPNKKLFPDHLPIHPSGELVGVLVHCGQEPGELDLLRRCSSDMLNLQGHNGSVTKCRASPAVLSMSPCSENNFHSFATPNWWGITNNKPPGPIIMMIQSKTPSSKLDHIH
jgi:hypothetical protein